MDSRASGLLHYLPVFSRFSYSLIRKGLVSALALQLLCVAGILIWSNQIGVIPQPSPA
ncbi:hypothetical protein MESS2_1520049 [Mesorhizobium metallidurans STM 2683]|uniref:Uncharacterized protein n=1 Tax=Mesorhizobium metallidurans STM 2683 TaxID=1297569 RepID=M5EM41_9HYPH|nr:hypothetical protein MESS2_1520049 [Mesorhizobium metallidurans STM 2683]